jgi:hypothetical protein
MDRNNHYEAAFEAYLQWHRLCYVAVNENRRSLLGDASLKNLDFIVFGEGGGCLVDVKGRRYPAGTPQRPRRVWESWSTHDDVRGLQLWAERFGPRFQALLVFAYQIQPATVLQETDEDLWSWRERRYLFRAIAIDDYRPHMRLRSPRWGTVNLPSDVFRSLVRPFDHFIVGSRSIGEECPF